MISILVNLNHMLGSIKPVVIEEPEHYELRLISKKVGELPTDLRDLVLKDLLPRNVFTEDQILQMDYALDGTRPKKWINKIVVEAGGWKFGKSIDGSKPKYITQPGWRLAKYGFVGEDTIDKSSPVILTEGVLDYHSLPIRKCMMSPGTSGMFNDRVFKLGSEFTLIEVPDSDIAGVEAFLRLVNKNMLPPDTKMLFCFVYWITKHIGDDINDLLAKYGYDRESAYKVLNSKALPAVMALSKLRDSFNIVHTKAKGWIVSKENKPDGRTKFSPDDKNSGTRDTSKPKKGKPGRDDSLSWF